VINGRRWLDATENADRIVSEDDLSVAPISGVVAPLTGARPHAHSLTLSCSLCCAWAGRPYLAELLATRTHRVGHGDTSGAGGAPVGREAGTCRIR
jgi:hypothetical protein